MPRIYMLLAGFGFLLILAGCAGSEAHTRTTQVEIIRHDTAGLDTMRALCQEVRQQAQLQPPQANAQSQTETNIYRENGPSGSEYRRVYRETSRYSAAAADRDQMIQLCIQGNY